MASGVINNNQGRSELTLNSSYVTQNQYCSHSYMGILSIVTGLVNVVNTIPSNTVIASVSDGIYPYATATAVAYGSNGNVYLIGITTNGQIVAASDIPSGITLRFNFSYS